LPPVCTDTKTSVGKLSMVGVPLDLSTITRWLSMALATVRYSTPLPMLAAWISPVPADSTVATGVARLIFRMRHGVEKSLSGLLSWT
jgi:hypothetical protein